MASLIDQKLNPMQHSLTNIIKYVLQLKATSATITELADVTTPSRTEFLNLQEHMRKLERTPNPAAPTTQAQGALQTSRASFVSHPSYPQTPMGHTGILIASMQLPEYSVCQAS